MLLSYVESRSVTGSPSVTLSSSIRIEELSIYSQIHNIHHSPKSSLAIPSPCISPAPPSSTPFLFRISLHFLPTKSPSHSHDYLSPPHNSPAHY